MWQRQLNFLLCGHLGNYRVKETCSTRSIQVTYETDHISLCCDPTMSKALNFCFFIYFIATQKKKIILREKNIAKRKIFICEISIIIILIC